MFPKVLFVSKPVAPPFHDGTKCLVRDVASALTRFEAHVMSTSAPSTLPERVRVHPVYESSGRFTPGLGANARAAAWLALRARADVWHYVFAPNARTSGVGRWLRRARRVPVLQTVASPPREFRPEWFFGDVVVAQSAWTRDQIADCFENEARRPPEMAVVPPPVGQLEVPTDERKLAARAALKLEPDERLLLYPGDLETSIGAEVVARSVAELVRRVPRAVVVFAYRAKTPKAAGLAAELEHRLAGQPVRISGDVPDFLALLACATTVLFPVNDLYGKVDLPIALLEAMQLGIPVIALDDGPLRDLQGAVKIRGDLEARLVEECVSLTTDADRHRSVVRAAKQAVVDCYAAQAVAQAYEALYERLLTQR